MELKRVEATIRGRVQGVYFRQSTRAEGQRLNLVGWVCNEADGTVTVAAEGPEPALQQLLAFLRQGPPGARVDEVASRWATATGEFVNFHVRYL